MLAGSNPCRLQWEESSNAPEQRPERENCHEEDTCNRGFCPGQPRIGWLCVGDASMPAGTYRITHLSQAVILIRNQQNPSIATMEVTNPNDSALQTDRK